jgi:glutathione S-transferase
MQLYYAATSPFVRKCLVTAHELGLRDRLELLPAAAHPVNRDAALVARNPLGKIPTLLINPGDPQGASLYDSRVICEYLNGLGDGHLLAATGAARWAALTLQALADGIMDAAVLTRYETAVRPENLRWSAWVDGQLAKVHSGLEELERQAQGFGERVDIGTIALGCALGYLDFRYAALAWRERHPATAAWFERFAQRKSMQLTAPPTA